MGSINETADEKLWVEDAATFLGVNSRTVRRYISKGYLRSEYCHRKLMVYKSELLQLKKDEEEPIPFPINRMSLARLHTRVTTLERHVATLMRILDVRYDPLNLTDAEMLSLYRQAEHLSLKGWSPYEEEPWSEYFLRMKLEDIEQCSRVSEDPHPWRAFLRLVSTMFLQPFNKDLRDNFAAGKNNLHGIAATYCQLKGESPKAADILTKRDAAPMKRLLNKLAKTG